MSGFESPNYTQTPNDFFEMLPEMEHSEIAVTLVMIRETFGFHRNSFKMGINKLADAAGLSRNAAKDGAEAAEKRGTFRRVNPDAQTEAEWELVVDGQPVTTPGQPVTTPPPLSDQQVRVKERIKKPIKEKEEAAKPQTPPEIKAYRETTKKFPNTANFEDVVELIQKVSTRLGRAVLPDDLRPYYKEWTGRGYNQFSIKWLEWAAKGSVPPQGKPQNPTLPQGVSVSQSWLAKKMQEQSNG